MRGCHVMAKPTSSSCNIQCRYCFYLEKPRQPVMDDATLEAFIRQHIAAQPGDTVEFAWQGGEPTLAGLPFYRRVVALQKRYAAGKRIQNTMQTNGVLLNDAWCCFFRENGWLVGISIDGPADLHDAYRRTRSGKPTHHLVLAAVEKLKAHRIEFNLLTVVNQHNSRQPERLYRYLKTLGTPFLQFIPLVERDESGAVTPESVSPEQLGRFLNAVFDIWVREDIGNVFVQLFDSTLGVWSGYPAQMCTFSESCGHAFALEANGDVYQCDHYVYPAYKLGNLHSVSLGEINQSPAAIRFGENKHRLLAQDCQICPVRRLCQGDCPKHRISQGKSYLCHGYHSFFTHSAPYMKVMRDLLAQRRSPAELMGLLS
ncbi:anaerobic sulfatase maturase [Enterobacteriaceae bacterium H20N1]|uniref:Anaerobic sulfatase maturase n=1 Tax=Dryocola boscaweniae TaxID=2925397 RepID=A0A9X2W607_9ENTR|nr:anaerobic sulfatase maturase [Dryocola boscaweniae]MCT4700648.1 anaerobic sulfatase maturase [Dryocola boscaweniae]MCT4717748.1 anaerobic sulfatase maturase [Dryocola boscaweniae]